MKWNKSAAAVLIVALGVGAVVTSKTIFSKGIPLFKPAIGPRAQGNPNAQFKIIEYMDMQCHSCAEASPLMKNYIYTYPSKIYWQVKFYPLVKSHLYALKSAIYAECSARQNKFWPFYESVLENQKEWAESADPDAIFARLAKAAALDENMLKACVDTGDAKKIVLNEAEEAVSAGVTATPSFFVNGKMVVGPKGLQEELDKLLH